MVAAPGLTTVDFVPTLQAVGPSAVPTRSSTGCSPLPLGRRVKGRICSGLCAAHKHGPATSGPDDRCGHRASDLEFGVPTSPLACAPAASWRRCRAVRWAPYLSSGRVARKHRPVERLL